MSILSRSLLVLKVENGFDDCCRLLSSLVFIGGVIIGSLILWQALQRNAQDVITKRGEYVCPAGPLHVWHQLDQGNFKRLLD